MNPNDKKKIIDSINEATVSTKELRKILTFIHDNEVSKDCYMDKYSNGVIQRGIIQINLSTENYSSLLYTQGERFLKGLLAYYQQEEQFEKCTKIVAAIQQHNSFDNDNKLTTNLI